jgi:hypothetical protein
VGLNTGKAVVGLSKDGGSTHLALMVFPMAHLQGSILEVVVTIDPMVPTTASTRIIVHRVVVTMDPMDTTVPTMALRTRIIEDRVVVTMDPMDTTVPTMASISIIEDRVVVTSRGSVGKASMVGTAGIELRRNWVWK